MGYGGGMSSEWISPARNLALELVRTTEAAAMAQEFLVELDREED